MREGRKCKNIKCGVGRKGSKDWGKWEPLEKESFSLVSKFRSCYDTCSGFFFMGCGGHTPAVCLRSSLLGYLNRLDYPLPISLRASASSCVAGNFLLPNAHLPGASAHGSLPLAPRMPTVGCISGQ